MALLDPMGPIPKQKCKAHSKQTGAPCKQWAILGGAVCRYHGGAAPQVIAAAEQRLEQLKPAAIQYLGWLVGQQDYPSAGLGAAKDILDRTDGKPTEKMDLHVSGDAEFVARLQAARKRVAK